MCNAPRRRDRRPRPIVGARERKGRAFVLCPPHPTWPCAAQCLGTGWSSPATAIGPVGPQPALSKSMVEIGTDPPARHGGQKRRPAAGFLKSDRCASQNTKPTRNPNTRARAARLLRHLLLVRLLRRSHGSLPSCLNCGRVPNELRLPDASYDPINEMNAT